MHTENLIVRCMAKQEGGLWVAVCIDYSLAAQADTFEEARRKLQEQIRSYVREAYTVDHEHAAELLTRRAPLLDRVAYRFQRMLQRLLHRVRTYLEPVPLVPAALGAEDSLVYFGALAQSFAIACVVIALKWPDAFVGPPARLWAYMRPNNPPRDK